MKEYKKVTYYDKFAFNIEKKDSDLTEFLNNFARQGWRVISNDANMVHFILERDKNR